MGIFSDMNLGTVILIVAVIGLAIKFGGANVFRDDGKKGGSGKSSGGGSSSGSDNTPQ